MSVVDDVTFDRVAEVIGQTMLRDRHRLERRLHGLSRRSEPTPDQLAKVLVPAEHSAAMAASRRASVPALTYPVELPVSQKRGEIIDAVRDHRCVVVCGETGSGKTTQLPKICLEAGRGVYGTIGHTQPRRIAARTVAARVADEMKSSLGETVGYKVRFHDETSPTSLVKLMTDGILLAEMQGDRFLNQYDTIIVDEAHERSLNIDFLLGHLKNLLDLRPELKVVVTSATIDPQRFSDHFGGPDVCPVIMVSGRTYPVEVRYRPLFDGTASPDREGGVSEDRPEPLPHGRGSQPEEINDAIIAAVDELGRDPTVAGGDTLVFLSGEREIREAAKALEDHVGGRHGQFGAYEVLPLYARLSNAEQNRVFKTGGKRRVVLATNVAETSLTVPGIRSVVDTGLARISRYSARSKVQRLPIEAISQASSDQRKGRCGRLGDGVCIRLFDEPDFASRPEFTDPEITRTNLAAVILQMSAFGLGAVEQFPFIDPPDPRQVRDGYQTLQEIGGLDEHRRLTTVGRQLARLPVDPKFGRMILAAAEEDCLDEMIIIAAGLSVQDPRERPMDKRKEADDAHADWKAGGSDLLTLVNLWRWYVKERRELSRNKLKQVCKARYVNYLRMMEWGDVQRQLREAVAGLGSSGQSRSRQEAGPTPGNWKLNRDPASAEQVHRAVLPGLLGNVGHKGEANEYDGVRGRKFFVFPGSVVFGSKPQWVVAAELVETSRLYARFVCSVKPEWVEAAAGDLVKKTYGEPYWQMKTGRVIAPMKVTLWGLPIAKRPIDYGKVDPKKSRTIFIKSALVDGDLESGAAFFRHNRQLVRDVELLEAKTRRRDLMVDPATQFAFYDARLPASVVDWRSFDSWRGDAEKQDRRLLYMRPEDLMARSLSEAEGGQFPESIETNGIELPLKYRFDPGHVADGVTATVHLADLHAIDADRLDWLVPGLIEEKVTDLIRTLPKKLRTQFVPVPEVAHRAVLSMRFGEAALTAAVAKYLQQERDVTLDEVDLRPDELSDYLKLNLRVIDENGRPVAHGRDVRELRKLLRVQARGKLAKLPDSPWHRDHIVKWSVGELPERVEIRMNGRGVQGFPALIDKGDSASLRLLETPEAARANHRRGVRRLLLIDYASQIKHQVSDLPDLRKLDLLFSPLGNAGSFRAHLIEACGDRLFLGEDAADVRDEATFEERVNAAWGKLGGVVKQVATVAQNVLTHRQQVYLQLDRRVPDILTSSVNDMKEQLAHLVPSDFLVRTPPGYLPHLPRYIAAISQRHTKLLDAGLDRDSRLATAVFPYSKAYLDRVGDIEAGPLSPRWMKFRWLLEEYRVSLFAQGLGTAEKVSDKKLSDLLATLK